MEGLELLVPRVVAWEVTRACPLACIHCRAEAQHTPDPHQLTTQEGLALLADIAAMGGPTIVILTGGEPLTRPDIFDLLRFGSQQGLHMAVSPDDGRLLTPETVARLKAAGARRVSFSLHYPTAEDNDRFARTPGAFAAAMEGLANLRAGELPFQINTTVTCRNVDKLPQLLTLVRSLEPVAWDLFFLVPTGRAAQMVDDEMPPEQYEQTLNWLYDLRAKSALPVKQTCAPQFRRLERQRANGSSGGRPPDTPDDGHHYHPGSGGDNGSSGGRPPDTGAHGATPPFSGSRRHDSSSRGCLCGNGFCFVSHVGEVQGCGYLPLSAGNVRERRFSEIYRSSSLFAELRDVKALKGKCGVCEYRQLCGGCRARAYAVSGDYLGEEPHCVYEPRRHLSAAGTR